MWKRRNNSRWAEKEVTVRRTDERSRKFPKGSYIKGKTWKKKKQQGTGIKRSLTNKHLQRRNPTLNGSKSTQRRR